MTAEASFVCDPKYLFRRLPIIVLKGVPLGNFPPCAEAFTHCRNLSLLGKLQGCGSARAWIHADEAKAGRAIGVLLNEDALEVLRSRQGQRGQYVFMYKGKPVERCTTKAWDKACERAGIEDFRWHDLRHTWASWHVQSGTSLQELMELGSWAIFEMVMRYAHLAADHLRAAACRLDGTFTSQSARGHHLRAA